MYKFSKLVAVTVAIFTTFQTTTVFAPTKPKTKPIVKQVIKKVVYNQPTLPSRASTEVYIPPAPKETPSVLFEVTEYTAGEESTGKTPSDPAYGITASGTHIKQGDCACSRDYPFGTKFIINGTQTVTCTDRGGAINGRHIDVYEPSLRRALDFGRKLLPVIVILPT